jgi:hypothetical protein
MNIYLASSWKNRERVRAFAIELRKHDHEVYDFTDPNCRKGLELPPEAFPEEFDPDKHMYFVYINRELWYKSVQANKEALDRCDVVILMLPCGSDAHADAFYALGRGKRLIVTGQPRKGERTPTHLWAEVILYNDGNAISYLKDNPFGPNEFALKE